jgi:hypothetical protein
MATFLFFSFLKFNLLDKVEFNLLNLMAGRFFVEVSAFIVASTSTFPIRPQNLNLEPDLKMTESVISPQRTQNLHVKIRFFLLLFIHFNCPKKSWSLVKLFERLVNIYEVAVNLIWSLLQLNRVHQRFKQSLPQVLDGDWHNNLTHKRISHHLQPSVFDVSAWLIKKLTWGIFQANAFCAEYIKDSVN